MLFRKMLRDIRINKTQFISIFIMSILGVMIYAGVNAGWYGMQSEVDGYYKETRMPDLWVISDGFTKEDALEVEGIKGVTDTELRLTFDATVVLENKLTLRVHVIEENLLGLSKSLEGVSFDLSKDGLWLDASFANANALKVGDLLTLELKGIAVKKEILGLIIHPEYVHNVKDDATIMPNPKTFGFAFIPRQALPQGASILANQLLVAVNSEWKETVGRPQLEHLFSERYSMIIDRRTHPSVAMFQGEIEQNKAMGEVFPIVFFMIAALTMLSTMTRMTSNQRTQIGTLKAMGFSKRKILNHYISYGIWIGLVGGTIGLIIGPLIIPNILIAMQETMYTLPDWSIKISPSSFVALSLAVVCCGASSYFACRQQLKEVPAVALRPKVPKTSRHTRLEKGRFWLKFSFSTQWNIRDIFRSKIRSVMAVIGVLGCTAILVFGFGLGDSVNAVSEWMYQDLHVYESKIYLNEEMSITDLEALKGKYGGQWIEEKGVEIKAKDEKESGSITILSQGSQMLLENENRQSLQLSKEDFIISYKMAQMLNVEIGDTIEWRIYGNKTWLTSQITGIYRTPMGQGIVINDALYNQMGLIFHPTALLTAQKADGADQLSGVKSVVDKQQMIIGFNDMLESLKMIILILVIAAVILGSVVLYNLGTLSFTERLRELATLKVLGFFPKEMRELLMQQNIWLTLIGMVLGAPTGFFLIGLMLSTMSASTDMMTEIKPLSLIISLVGTFAISLLVNLILSRKVKSIDMVSALKSVE